MKTIRAYILGMVEFRSDITTAYANHNLALAYDYGRDMMHRLTLRKWDA